MSYSFLRTKVQMLRRFEIFCLTFCTLHAHREAWPPFFFLFLLFADFFWFKVGHNFQKILSDEKAAMAHRRRNFWSKVGHNFQKISTDEKSDKRQENTTRPVRSLQWHTEDVCKIHGLNRKNGADVRQGICFLYVNQRVAAIRCESTGEGRADEVFPR